MVRGRDAADVTMITSFGRYYLELFRVQTDRSKKSNLTVTYSASWRLGLMPPP